MKKTRINKITDIISYLERLKEQEPSIDYAIDQNLSFFKNIQSVKDFWRWMRKEYPTIDEKRIKELSDIGNKKHDINLHKNLIKLERGNIPGLIKPFVNSLYRYIAKQKSPLVVAELGAGSMELTRQLIGKLLKKDYSYPLTFVSFDQSEPARNVAQINLSCYNGNISFHEIDQLTSAELKKITDKQSKHIDVVLCKNDIFKMDEDFENKQFDLCYHSFFKHHLPEGKKEQLDNIISKTSKEIYEYDGYQSRYGTLVQALFTWNHPVLMNGAVLSNSRYYKKQMLAQRARKENIKLFKSSYGLIYRGTYLRIFNKQ